MLSDRIFEILLDKGLLALVVALFGFVLGRVLERYKRDQALVLELGKARSAAIIATYGILAKYRSRTDQLIVALTTQRPPDELTRAAEGLDALHSELEDTISRHRFLLGEDFHQAAIEYANLQRDKADHVTKGDREGLLKCQARIRELQHQVQGFLPALVRP
jgi:hypothetical protein